MDKYIIIGIFSALFMAAFMFLPKKKTNKNNSSDRNICISRYNSYIDDLNFLISEYTIEFNKQLEMVQYLNSSSGVQDLRGFNRAFQEKKDLVERTMSTIKNRIGSISIEELMAQLNLIGAEIGNLSSIVDDIKNYEPKMNKRATFAQEETYYEETIPTEVVESDIFFGGCETKEDVEHRFRNLSKAFHPDASGGNADMFIKLQNAYNERIKDFI